MQCKVCGCMYDSREDVLGTGAHFNQATCTFNLRTQLKDAIRTVETARADERAAIVQFLRAYAERLNEEHESEWAMGVGMAADAVEAGEHRKETEHGL